ncbi:MAG: two-component response regulator [Thermoleophilia bacterium]|nr:two-component response regulator [Thermoleophilia bacterium]
MAPIRILLCDDAEPLRALYRIVFDAEDDFTVAGEAADGAAGVEAARTLQPEVVLLDIAMPVMDGLEAIPGIRAAAPDATIVMCTAMVDPRIRARALELGATDFVEKGADPRDLVATVRAAAAAREAMV